jgi:hypothetical protein
MTTANSGFKGVKISCRPGRGHYELNDKGVPLYRVTVIFDGWYCRREKAPVNSV